MSEKSYLKNQIRLVSLNANDLFTDREYDIYMEIVSLMNEIDRIETSSDPPDPIYKKELIAKRKQKSQELTAVIKQHKGTPRKVRLKSVLSQKKEHPPDAGVTWKHLKFSKKICEFESDMSRRMGLHHLDKTFDKIIIKWKNLDLLEQIVLDGFTMDLLNPDNTVETRHYRYFTSSAGQLRTDKIQCISTNKWEEIKDYIMCGLTWDSINEKGGVNVNKLLAYLALPVSATDTWSDFDIDRCIVIPDWKGEVTGDMLYINPDYTVERGIRTVLINHMDGSGMMLPDISDKNFMVRGPWFKGLLCVYDFLKFCKVHNCKPVIKDIWGLEHDLIKEDIKIIFTNSQFKMAAYYNSWDEYKTAFKANGCHFGKTNYEEEFIPDTQFNYQMIQTLDLTDDEIDTLVAREHRKIQGLAKDQASMLQILKASPSSPNPQCQALYLYPALLRDGYSRTQLKDIKKKLLYNAKSGAIRIKNKRLFAIPDLYAACEYYFLQKERPEGLLKDGEVGCRLLRSSARADVLRSPHLYMEHCVRKIAQDPKIYEWFITDGIYTSCHDLISRVLQFDVDGDQLNVVTEEVIVEAAERNVREKDIVPLFYDATKAPAETVSMETIFKGLKRAHEFSNIGEISDMLTRLWNRNNPDVLAAALLTYLNNLRIDGAKTGSVNEYTNYPNVAKRINKATGGKHGRMPFFFRFSKNGRTRKDKQYANPTNSTMNRICARFNDIGNINMNWAGVEPFNYQMFLTNEPKRINKNIVELFGDIDSLSISSEILLGETSPTERTTTGMYELLAEIMEEELTEKFGSLDNCYSHIVKALFDAEGIKKPSHKRMFWRVFGQTAVNNLKENLKNCRTCPHCGAKIPNWVKDHRCPKAEQGFMVCVDCGKLINRTGGKQNRCEKCQVEHRNWLRRQRRQEKQKRQEELRSKCITFLPFR